MLGEGGGEKQQVRRHLLDTVGTPMHVTNPHISYIRLEGVDSSGNVSQACPLLEMSFIGGHSGITGRSRAILSSYGVFAWLVDPISDL